MRSEIVGVTNLDELLLSKEADEMLKLEYNDAYSEFIIGKWKNCVLWNENGHQTECTLREYDGSAVPTVLAAGLKCVDTILNSVVEKKYLKWARVFLLERGIVLPHRDFIDMKEGFTRLHIVFKTNPACLHSEGQDVFHMRAGEIWFLEANRIHAAANFSSQPRVTLCLDFAPGIGIDRLLKRRSQADKLPPPELVTRPPLLPTELQSITKTLLPLRHDNFREVVGKLAEIHFRSTVCSDKMYEWLIQLSRQSEQRSLVTQAQKLRDQTVGPDPIEGNVSDDDAARGAYR